MTKSGNYIRANDTASTLMHLISKAASPASTYVKRHGISLMLLM